jgi:hypothetical protein
MAECIHNGNHTHDVRTKIAAALNATAHSDHMVRSMCEAVETIPGQWMVVEGNVGRFASGGIQSSLWKIHGVEFVIFSFGN